MVCDDKEDTRARACRGVRLVWADAGYHADKLAAWAESLKMRLHDPPPGPARPLIKRSLSLEYEVLLHVRNRFFTHTDEAW